MLYLAAVGAGPFRYDAAGCFTARSWTTPAAASCLRFGSASGCTTRYKLGAGHWNQPVNWAPVKWLDAMKYCATYGKTLCGSSNAARCQNRGCHYNNIYQWTNEPCEPEDAGYDCAA